MFLWRTTESYPLIITKYPPYLFHCNPSNEPSHEIMVLSVLRNLILQNAHTQPSNGARCQIFGRTLRLLPYFMCANSEGSSKTAWMRRLAWALADCLCDKYHNLMSWNYLILCLHNIDTLNICKKFDAKTYFFTKWQLCELIHLLVVCF